VSGRVLKKVGMMQLLVQEKKSERVLKKDLRKEKWKGMLMAGSMPERLMIQARRRVQECLTVLNCFPEPEVRAE
jgi:hypothetical protein